MISIGILFVAKRLIICAGQSRSGSTWQYNAARTLASAAGSNSYGAWIADYDPIRPEETHIVKMHDPRHLGSMRCDVVVTAYRDLRSVLASERRMLWHNHETPKQIGGFLDRYLENLAIWEDVAVRVMRYEAMMNDPLAELRELSAALEFGLT